MAIINWKSQEEIDTDNIKFKVEELKTGLEMSDYKIIKTIEYQLLGLESPYDLNELHRERQDMRDMINDMESRAGED